jgi:tyrosyl-tRNA synthetase
MGGSDQWGNIVNGVELCRRINQIEVFGLTTPLLTTASGAKMGKTEQGAVWLDSDMLSPYDYWQYWRNTEDADVGRFLKLFTELPLDEIARLEALEGSELNEAKKILANEATVMIHGSQVAEQAAETARQTFEEKTTAGDLPTVEVNRADLAGGIPVVMLFRAAKLGKSNGEIRRYIQGGGAKINDVAIEDDKHIVREDALTEDGVIKLSVGKKRHVLVKPT